jgi:(2S)-methylsuccinyl-CoA dehydrogenase
MTTKSFLDDLREAADGAGHVFATARLKFRSTMRVQGEISTARLNGHQHGVHGLAWYGTYVEVLRQLAAAAAHLDTQDRLGAFERGLITLVSGEYLAQMLGGIAMSQSEIVRPADLDLTHDDLAPLLSGAAARLMAAVTQDLKTRIADLMTANGKRHTTGDPGLDDTLEAMGAQIHRFTQKQIIPHAQTWHLENAYVPLDIIGQMAELGVFALTLPEQYGGMALGKQSMCVVSEELSRGFIGVGSLGTRTEIAAELIETSGTRAQRQEYLPKLACGDCLPTAVFTEPDTGSDLACLTTRAEKLGDFYKITGNKTWITHAARSDLMLLLARTGPPKDGYRGLSMFLAPKPRGTDRNPFPATGMSGSEIEVIGYRGMKEFEIAFDHFEVSKDALLGGIEGEGFKQLMQTFETARIQTAARAVGVAQSAFDLGLGYAQERRQFGKAILGFPRIANKLAMMAAEIFAARQLTHFAARAKDEGRRCDLEAGMAKLLAARTAWSAADGGVQIHGGNGFATEFAISRVLCDARILSIFEGASEIQAQIIAKRLLDDAN